MHHSKQDDHGLPEINAFYNSTKSGVDAVDEKTSKYSCSRRTRRWPMAIFYRIVDMCSKCSKYSCSRRTRRWPMAIFYRIVDMCSVNAYVIHQSCANAHKVDRLDFLKLLAKQLYEPLLREQSQKQNLPRELKASIFRILKMTHDAPNDAQDVLPRNQRKYCSVCDPKLKRKFS
ncbi:Transposase IS4 [Popillia japonica]|uniref:Transposase IS4 n=1 Tax=Popillia japonica TaxID=7064 RepID=A0AAW1IF20_POPJA